MVTLKEEYDFIINKLFKTSGISARFNAITLLEHFAGIKKHDLVLNPTKEISPNFHDLIIEATNKMLEGYPLQYILGEWEFYGRRFIIGEGVLIPRQDTEVLIETAITLIKDKKSPRMLDLCSGSGCIAVTLAKEVLGSEVYAVELSDDAFSYLKQNVALHDCKNLFAIKGDVFKQELISGLGQFDLIVSNPPYISESEKCNLQPELSYEPEIALFCENNGLKFYEHIAKFWKASLKSKGSFVFEIGNNQAGEVRDILLGEGFEKIQIRRDLNDLNRVIVGTRVDETDNAVNLEVTKNN